jgi:hypothetical protein
MLKTVDILRTTTKAAHRMSALWIAAVASPRRLLGSQFDVFLKRSNLLFSNFSRSLALISRQTIPPAALVLFERFRFSYAPCILNSNVPLLVTSFISPAHWPRWFRFSDCVEFDGFCAIAHPVVDDVNSGRDAVCRNG